MNDTRGKTTLIIIMFVMILILITSCNSFFERAHRYTTIDEKAREIIANYIGFDVSKIQGIDKIIYQDYVRDSDMYIFAEVDWPELWESTHAITVLENGNLIDSTDGFTSDAHISYLGSNGRTLIIYRLYDKNCVAIYVDEYIVSDLWEQLEPYCKR